MPTQADKVAVIEELLNHARHGNRAPYINGDAFEWREALVARLADAVINSKAFSLDIVKGVAVEPIPQPEPAPQPEPEPEPEPESPLKVLTNEIMEASETQVRIKWTLSAPSTGQIEYGTTPELGTLSAKESGLLPRHRQYLSDLKPGTLYHYRVNSTDADGNSAQDSGTFTTKGAAKTDIEKLGNRTKSTAGSILAQWDNPPFYNRTAKPSRTITIDSQSDADAKYKDGQINGGDVVQVARGLDVVIKSPDFNNLKSTKDNPIHIEAYGTGVRPIFRGTGSREKKGGKGAAYYRVASFRNSHHVNYDGIRFTGAANHGIGIGDRDGNEPGACSHFIFNDCEIDNVGHGGFRAAFGSNHIKYIGGSIHHIGILPESVSNKKGAGVGEAGYWGKGGGDGYLQKWAANNVEFINVHMHDCLGELDLKRHSHNITYVGCLLENFRLWSQGAITGGLNPRHEAEYKDYNMQLLIDRCVIRLMHSRRSDGSTEPYGVCVGAGNVEMKNSIVDLVHGDAVHAYQDAHNSAFNELNISNCILIARNGHKSIEPLGSRSSTNKENAPLAVKALNNVVTTPTQNAAQVAGEMVIREDQLHTLFAGSESDFKRRGELSAREHAGLFLPG